MNLTDVDTEINKTVDRLVACPKNQISSLVLKLQSLWKKRNALMYSGVSGARKKPTNAH